MQPELFCRRALCVGRSVFPLPFTYTKLNSFLSNVPFNESARRQKRRGQIRVPIDKTSLFKEDEDNTKRRNKAAQHKLVEVVHLLDAGRWTPGSPIDASGLDSLTALAILSTTSLHGQIGPIVNLTTKLERRLYIRSTGSTPRARTHASPSDESQYQDEQYPVSKPKEV